MGIENGGSGGGPPLARRPFKLATAAPPTMLLRNLAIAASVALLVATLVVVIPSTGMSGVVGSASHYLTTASLYVSSASAQLNSLAAGAATNGSSAEGGATPGADGGSSSGDAGADAEGGGGETPDEAAEGDGGDGGGVDGEGVDPDLPCRESGYCSVGKLQAYVGEVDSTEGFKAMLKASCYKKECIMLTIGTGGHTLGMNFIAGAWKLGLANVMLHARGNESCAVLTAAGYNNVTCVWSDRDWFPVKNGKWHIFEAEELWAVRYILMARAVWHGYNVWLLDTDTYLYRDPYKYLTVPPFKDIPWMSLQDGGNIVNGGSSYIHNAAPGGPAAWTIARMCEHMIRLNEQFVLSDIIAGNYLRHPYIRFTMWTAPELDPDVESGVRYHEPGVVLRYPPEWQELTQASESKVLGFNLTIPYLNGTWNESIAGKRFPPRLNYSEAFIKMLEEESGGVKYADWEGSPPEGYVVPQNETFIFTPEWLLAAWLGRGVNGWWDLPPPKPQVMLHALFIPGEVHPPWKKEYILKASGAFNFEVSKALHGQLFPAATPGAPLPRVLALLPGLNLPSETALEYRNQLLLMVRLAARVGRVLLLPEPVCNSPWLGPGNEKPRVQGHRKNDYNIGLLLTYGLDDDQHCIWWHVLDFGCMPGRYILHPDYRELVRRLPEGAGQPSGDNTVQLGGLERAQGQEQVEVEAAETKAEEGGGEKQAQEGSPAGAPKRRNRRLAEDSAPKDQQQQQQQQQQPKGPSLAATAEAAKQKDGPHILFLDAIPDLTPGSWPEEGEADKGWKDWVQQCNWAREDPPKQDRRRRLAERERHQQGAARLRQQRDQAITSLESSGVCKRMTAHSEASSRVGAHLLRHGVTAEVRAAAAAWLGSDAGLAGRAICQLRKKELQEMFQRVYGATTSSCNNDWLRGKLLQAVGLPARWRQEVEDHTVEDGAEKQQSSGGGGAAAQQRSRSPGMRLRQTPARQRQRGSGGSSGRASTATQESGHPGYHRGALAAGAAPPADAERGRKRGRDEEAAPGAAGPRFGGGRAAEAPPPPVVVLVMQPGAQLPPWAATAFNGGALMAPSHDQLPAAANSWLAATQLTAFGLPYDPVAASTPLPQQQVVVLRQQQQEQGPRCLASAGASRWQRCCPTLPPRQQRHSSALLRGHGRLPEARQWRKRRRRLPRGAQFPQESVNQGDLTSPAQQQPRATPTAPPPQPQRQPVTGSWVRRVVAEVNEAAPPLVVGRHTPSHRDDVAAAPLQTAQRQTAQQQQGQLQQQSGGTRSGDGSAVQHPPARHPLGQQQLQQPQQPQQSTALRMFHLAAKGAAQAQGRASSRHSAAAAAAGQHPALAHLPAPRAMPQPAATAPAQLGLRQHQHALPLLLPLPQLPQPPRVQASVNQAGPPGAMPPPPPRALRSAAGAAVLSAAGPSWDRPRLMAGAVDAARAAISGGRPETVLPLLVQAAAQRGAEEAGLSLELLCAHQANFEALNPVARGSRAVSLLELLRSAPFSLLARFLKNMCKSYGVRVAAVATAHSSGGAPA
ncbi:hypothetical protein CHLNCDRAFT_55051 [Chlorella variabilis]|uniref:Nucleotide-diphospho-sugar transferase domain-containing protein n=1 Tax=Chlorella variabilis TaxID=554065 RepID=E1ZRL3_CHLVA|nr:hypothetical protein CHLNCDRAFT_55051 [Chlorella variabilis]EFN51487.1 hypothetical protein CHLNCDRAFT_55051 [Chlorella variabilis]|eukprot:XP_005843589.1 hypothetical protein CHLNCDRAFT_55051 [Chlorella variabilis]